MSPGVDHAPQVMEAANTCPLVPLAPHMVAAGSPCLARFSQDNTIYRSEGWHSGKY